MQDHMIPFTFKGKKYVKNTITGKTMDVAEIELPSFNEMDSLKAYPNGVRPKELERGEKDQDATKAVAETHGTSCGPKPKAPKGSVQREKFEKYQQGLVETKLFLGIFPPKGARATMYKTLLTGEWHSKSYFVPLMKGSKEKVESTYRKLKSTGKNLGQWTMDSRINPQTGEVEYRLIMNKANDKGH